jgi:hypothetical protein
MTDFALLGKLISMSSRIGGQVIDGNLYVGKEKLGLIDIDTFDQLLNRVFQAGYLRKNIEESSFTPAMQQEMILLHNLTVSLINL